MLPSQRTLRLMAAINEGNSKNARLVARFGNTTTRMVFDVLDHLCVWAGCDVCPPPSMSSPAAIGGISHRRRKQKLGNCRSPCACLATGFAGKFPCWSCVQGQPLGSDRDTGICHYRWHGQRNTWLARLSSAGWLPNLHILSPVPFTAQLFWGGEPFGPISSNMMDQCGTTDFADGLSLSRGTLHTGVLFPFVAFAIRPLGWHQSTAKVKCATF